MVHCMVLLALVACASSSRETPFSSQMPPAVNMDGLMVGNGNWLALYTHAADTATQSRCTAACIQEWQPLYAQKTDTPRGDFGIIQRPDGTKQWTLMGKPLYYWVHDTETGKAQGGENNPNWSPFLVDKYQ